MFSHGKRKKSLVIFTTTQVTTDLKGRNWQKKEKDTKKIIFLKSISDIFFLKHKTRF